MFTSLLALTQIIAAIVAVILLPGYLFSRALFSDQQRDVAQQLAISGSLGLIMTVSIGTILIESKIGFRSSSYLLLLGIVCLLLCIIWRYRVQNTQLFRKDSQGNQSFLLKPKIWKLSIVPLAAVLMLIYVSIIPSYSSGKEGFTEFYITDEYGEVPFQLEDGSNSAIVAVIVNHGTESKAYKIQTTTQNGQLLYESNNVYLNINEKHVERFNIKSDLIGTQKHSHVNIDLIEDDNTYPSNSLRLSTPSNSLRLSTYKN